VKDASLKKKTKERAGHLHSCYFSSKALPHPHSYMFSRDGKITNPILRLLALLLLLLLLQEVG